MGSARHPSRITPPKAKRGPATPLEELGAQTRGAMATLVASRTMDASQTERGNKGYDQRKGDQPTGYRRANYSYKKDVPVGHGASGL
ncbi:hypothetical protein N7447_003504 [Penicillium robsamsonii]|uniref:uncharacterized protein n=1 Tax=Penicillium robsamsonii TaxID=1792511 RepID=UPI002549C10A|nr:uncharacterized protein N7447_003504 [Penicillium robsamsonii]KAJ5826741.1 hypothetical protein N7447_003504 [Penicillium robsamsonii]